MIVSNADKNNQIQQDDHLNEKRPGGHSVVSHGAAPATMCWCGGARTGGYAFPNSSAPEPLAFPEFYGKYVKHLRLPPLRIDLPIMFTLTLDRRNKTGPTGQH